MLAQIEITDDDIDRVLADQLLEDWYHISKNYKVKLGHQRIAPYCKQFKSSRQFDDASTITNKTVTDEQFARIDLCVDKLELPHRAAIGIEMKNRQVKRKVWWCQMASTYDQALENILPFMREKGLFD